MLTSFLLSAIALVVAGIAIGGVAVVSLGIQREDRHRGLEISASSQLTRGARRLTGLTCSRSGTSGRTRDR